MESEYMWSSPQIGKLAGALAKAQAAFGKLIADKTGKIEGESKKSGKHYEYSYRYADLADALEACRACLNEHEIAVVQMPSSSTRNGIEVTTMLVHNSGEWIRSTPLFMPVSGGAQDVGSAITYARRYSLLAMVGLAPEDDDGRKAQDAAPKSWRGEREVETASGSTRRKPKAARKLVDDGERDEVMRALDSAVGAYAKILNTSKQAVFIKAAAHMKVSAAVPADLDTDAARTCERVVMERVRTTCTNAYRALCELAPEDFAPEAWQAEWSNMAGLDTWPERPSPEQYAAVHARMDEITVTITGDDDPTDGGAP